MTWMFDCAVAQAEGENHQTSFAMVRCTYCGKHAVGGYWCDDCGHTDVDKPDELVGHGPDKCAVPS